VLLRDVARLFQGYQYGEAGRQIYDFFWNEFADWYIEIAKLQLARIENGDSRVDEENNSTSESRISNLITSHMLVYVLDSCLRLLHPFTPFVTEELWGHLKHILNQAPNPYPLPADALINAAWPEPRLEESWEAMAVSQFSLVQDVVRAIRNLRAEKNVKPGKRISALIAAGERVSILQSQAKTIATLAQLSEQGLVIHEAASGRMDGYVALVVSGIEVYLPLANLVDVGEERARIEKELAEAERQAQRLDELLAGPFAHKAPAPVVQKEREKLALMHKTVQKLKEQLKSLA
jgi:valyl-tRNA synthetase